MSAPPAKRLRTQLSSQSASLHSRSTPSRASCQLRIDASYKKARTGVLTLPHGDVPLPVFMPVGTQGTIKGLTSEQVAEQGCKIILGNTYHLGTRPGTDLLARMGGLHEFMKWPHNMLTDSGGFQMVSLLDLATITEEGVLFRSPVDGSKMMLTPEESMRHQNNIGADVMMVLDDVCSSLETNRARVQEASERSIRWLDRCISAHARPDRQNLFGIVQGGLDPKLRRINLGEMLKRDRDLPGYAIGGLAGGEDKAQFWRVVHQCTSILPPNKPRYCMGVGYPLDLVVCVALGVDMFDCVWPCRTARFGTAIVPEGLLQLKRAQYKEDSAPISRECDCLTCRKYTRAYLHSVATKETVACHLLSVLPQVEAGLFHISSSSQTLRILLFYAILYVNEFQCHPCMYACRCVYMYLGFACACKTVYTAHTSVYAVIHDCMQICQHRLCT